MLGIWHHRWGGCENRHGWASRRCEIVVVGHCLIGKGYAWPRMWLVRVGTDMSGILSSTKAWNLGHLRVRVGGVGNYKRENELTKMLILSRC